MGTSADGDQVLNGGISASDNEMNGGVESRCAPIPPGTRWTSTFCGGLVKSCVGRMVWEKLEFIGFMTRGFVDMGPLWWISTKGLMFNV